MASSSFRSCRNCGANIGSTAYSCSVCGSELNNQTEPPNTSVPLGQPSSNGIVLFAFVQVMVLVCAAVVGVILVSAIYCGVVHSGECPRRNGGVGLAILAFSPVIVIIADVITIHAAASLVSIDSAKALIMRARPRFLHRWYARQIANAYGVPDELND